VRRGEETSGKKCNKNCAHLHQSRPSLHIILVAEHATSNAVERNLEAMNEAAGVNSLASEADTDPHEISRGPPDGPVGRGMATEADLASEAASELGGERGSGAEEPPTGGLSIQHLPCLSDTVRNAASECWEVVAYLCNCVASTQRQCVVLPILLVWHWTTKFMPHFFLCNPWAGLGVILVCSLPRILTYLYFM
jgi:hypothetical protein